MKRDVTQFLESDILERYLLGTTTVEETQQAEHFIAKHSEVKEAYRKLQENLEAYATSFAVKAPETVRENVMATIAKRKPAATPWYFVAAGIAALVFAVSSIYFWDRSRTLSEENMTISNRIEALEQDINATKTELSNVQDQVVVLSDPALQRYILTGNEKAEDLKTLAYINPEEGTSYINVINLPELPKEQCYQMWADVDGEMVSLAVLENTDGKLVEIPYKETATSYNITIEPQGGNDHATVENLVANVVL